MGLAISYNNKRLIILSVIKLSGRHCTCTFGEKLEDCFGLFVQLVTNNTVMYQQDWERLS